MKTLLRKLGTTALRIAGDAGESMSLRRWGESAKTDRLNQKHWQDAQDRPLNLDLIDKLTTLRVRSEYEASTNAIVEGMIATHMVDLVGEDGPRLQLRTKDKAYAKKAEKIWRGWWAMPDINGQLSGPDMLRMWVRLLWLSGEYLAQKVVDPDARGPVKQRLQNLHPRRLGTPADKARDDTIVLGVERTRTGKPIAYWINDAPDTGTLNVFDNFRRIPAEQVIHRFRIDEPGQVRGVPWLACVLQTVADLRDYDVQVMDAARAAADLCVLMFTKHPDAKYLQVNESASFERRQISTLPPGWEFGQVTPAQPAATYCDFRNEKLMEIGRPVSMPLMKVRLDSSKHNYSSARFDGQVYARGLAALGGGIERGTLTPLALDVFREAQLAGALSKPPDDLELTWTWPKQPHVDPLKESSGEQVYMENGTMTLQDACASRGLDWEEVVEQRAREKEALEAAGLPFGPSYQTTSGQPIAGVTGKAEDQALIAAATKAASVAVQNNKKAQRAALMAEDEAHG